VSISVCIDAVLPGSDIVQKLRGLKSTGVRAFEFWSWWDKDLVLLKEAMDETGLTLAAMCTKFVSLTDPARRGEYLNGLEESIAVAHKLGCKTLISQIGNDTGRARNLQHESIVEGLKASVPFLEKAGLSLVIEPLNLIDHKGYYLWQSSEGFDIIREIASPRIRLLYDIYHQQVMEGNIVNTITANAGLIGHMHAAGLPGRGPLDKSELDYRFIFDALRKAGYAGYIGLEYFTTDGDPFAGIKKALDLAL
jgi:hydroxypyruvate isomerase